MGVRVVFETHATSEDNERGLASGWRRTGLSRRGEEQALELGRRRASDGIAAIFTSDLRRATETVELAFPRTEVPIFVDWRLRECHYGQLDGAEFAEVHADHCRWLNARYPAGESWTQAVERVAGCLYDVCARWPGQRVLIVGHLATRWALDHVVHGKSLDEVIQHDDGWRPGWEYELNGSAR